MMGRDESLLDHALRRRRRRRFPRFVPALLVLGVVVGIVLLWRHAFAPIFIEPKEWHARQLRFERAVRNVVRGSPTVSGEPTPDLPAWPDPLGDDQVRLLACTEAQVARGVRFTRTYHAVRYPWGDVPEHLTTPPDLLVRCLRALGLDLQQLVHIDRTEHKRRYPLFLWSDKRSNRSVDHRRMPNLSVFAETFFEKLSIAIDTPEAIAAFQPGDVVFWTHDGSHGFPGLVGFVSDRREQDGMPLVVTILASDGRVTMTHRLDAWQLHAHYRVRTDAVLERFLEAYPGATLLPRPSE